MSQVASSASGSKRSHRRLPRILLAAAAVALALFHLRLFWQRLSDLSVLEPWIAAKWLISALLVVGLWRLKAAGYRLVSGKGAGVIWLLALLLHVQLPLAPVSATLEAPGLEPVTWLLAVPVSASIGAALALALGLALALFAASVPGRGFASRRASKRRLGVPLWGAVASHLSRPPPLPF